MDRNETEREKTMKDKLQSIKEEALAQIEEAGVLDKLNDVRVNFLGRKGKLTAVLKSMKDVPPEERPAFGQLVNETRAQIESVLEEMKKKLEAQALELQLKSEVIDVTLPAKKSNEKWKMESEKWKIVKKSQ